MIRASFILLWALALASSARAQPAAEPTGAEAVETEVRALVESGDRRAVAELRQRVRDGLPPQLLSAVIAGLARTRRGDAVPVLEELSRYRRPAIRKEVAEAFGQLGQPSGVRILARMLDDASPAVRASAAQALGELGPRSAMDELLRAAKRGVPQALTVVGLAATPMHVARILRDLDGPGAEALAPALSSFATREDLNRAVRIRVVQKLGELGTPGAQRTLQQIASALPEGDRVRKAAEDAMAAAAEAQGEAEQPAPTPRARRETRARETTARTPRATGEGQTEGGQ